MAGLRLGRFGDDGDDVVDVDAAMGGEVFAAKDGGTDGDEDVAGVGVFGNFKRETFDACDNFGGVEVVAWGKLMGAVWGFLGERTYESIMDIVARSSSFIEPWSTCGKNNVSGR